MRDEAAHRELMRQLGVPARLTAPATDRPPVPSSVGSGELSGVRAVMDNMRRNGESRAQVQSVANRYDRLVREGKEPPPKG